MFNFYVIFAGHDMVTDALEEVPRAGAKWIPMIKKQKYKNWRTFRKHGF